MRFMAPVLLGAILIVMILYVMNFGGRRESLAARAESAFIRWAMTYGQLSAGHAPSPVVTISVTDDDLPAVKISPVRPLIDANISEYAAVLERVAAHHPNWVVVSWLTYAHPLSAEYLHPLTSVIDRLNLRDRVTIAVNLYATETIPSDFMRAYNIVEARDCYYDVNLFCTVLKEWAWMPQQVMNRFMSPDRPWVISKNLPHSLPNILLNLPDASRLHGYSFLDFRPPVMANIPEGAVVFIGNNMSQDFGFRDNKDALQKTYVASSNATRTLMKDGVPWHVFWAQMTEMFIQKQYISVLPGWVGWAAITVLVLLVLIGMFFSRWWTLWGLFAAALLLIFVNLVTVPILSLYIPVMPLAMTVMTLFIGATFTAVAYSSYSKWRLQAQTDLVESTTDVKQNFIHLISHNLNTPIAQLRGILEILSSGGSHDEKLAEAMRVLEFMRVTVRSVLNAATLGQQAPRMESCQFRALVQEFTEVESGFFKRIGVNLLIHPAETDDDAAEIWFYRFDLDSEMTRLCMLYAIVIVIMRHRCEQIKLDFIPLNDEPADPQGLRVIVSAEKPDALHLGVSPDFAIDALSRFLEMARSRGIVLVEDSGAKVTLVFRVQGQS
jgi:signal transduction histidine kinase